MGEEFSISNRRDSEREDWTDLVGYNTIAKGNEWWTCGLGWNFEFSIQTKSYSTKWVGL